MPLSVAAPDALRTGLAVASAGVAVAHALLVAQGHGEGVSEKDWRSDGDGVPDTVGEPSCEFEVV